MNDKQTKYVPKDNYFNWYYCGITDMYYSQSPCNDCRQLAIKSPVPLEHLCGDNPKRVDMTTQVNFEMPEEKEVGYE